MPGQSELGHLAETLAAMNSSERVALANRAGVAPLLAHRAAESAGRTNVRAFEGGVFVSLCAAAGIDPMPEIKTDIAKQYGPFLWVHLALAAKGTRFLRNLSHRAAAKAFRVEKTALHRIEHGTPVSIGPLFDLCRALQRHPFDFLQPALFHAEHKLHRLENIEAVA